MRALLAECADFLPIQRTPLGNLAPTTKRFDALQPNPSCRVSHDERLAHSLVVAFTTVGLPSNGVHDLIDVPAGRLAGLVPHYCVGRLHDAWKCMAKWNRDPGDPTNNSFRMSARNARGAYEGSIVRSRCVNFAADVRQGGEFAFEASVPFGNGVAGVASR
jgi:hypothetical protein